MVTDVMAAWAIEENDYVDIDGDTIRVISKTDIGHSLCIYGISTIEGDYVHLNVDPDKMVWLILSEDDDPE